MLVSAHLASLQAAYSDLKRQALEGRGILLGTPGSVTVRTVSGREFFYRQYYDAQGRKAADYIGAVDDAGAAARAEGVREQIATANALLGLARVLSRGGYVRVDARTDAVLTALAAGGLFRAGAVLVGSHAFGALLNDAGVRAAAYSTEDVDIARGGPLDLATPRSFEDLLADARLDLRPVPPFDRKAAPTSWKPPGADRLRVDLLAPTAGEAIKVIEVRELRAHAMALPYLRYAIASPVDAIVLGRSAVVPVKVPRPERLAWHKMLVSALRSETSDKKDKDVDQAAVLFAVLADREPGALEEAWEDLPRSARSKVRRVAPRVRARLVDAGHARAAEILDACAS